MARWKKTVRISKGNWAVTRKPPRRKSFSACWREWETATKTKASRSYYRGRKLLWKAGRIQKGMPHHQQVRALKEVIAVVQKTDANPDAIRLWGNCNNKLVDCPHIKRAGNWAETRTTALNILIKMWQVPDEQGCWWRWHIQITRTLTIEQEPNCRW